MNARLLSYMLAAAVSVSACTSDWELPSSQPQPESQMAISGNQEAVDFANKCMSKIFPQTRVSGRTIKDVQFSVRQSTRAQRSETTGVDTIITVNYELNSGYVMFGKKSTMKKLIAIADEGNINFNDTTFNKGLQYYLKDVSNNIVMTLDHVWGDDPFGDGPVTVKEPEIRRYPPVLSRNVRLWNQTDPYNYYCPSLWCDYTHRYENAYTGCVPLSVSQVMTHYEWPASHGTISFDWQAIKESPYNYYNGIQAYKAIATLVYTLGSQENLKTKYGVYPNGSSTPLKNVIPVLKKWGYNASGKWNKNYRYEYLSGNDSNRKPILVCGTDKEDDTESHQWVADGSMYVYYFGNNDDVITNSDKFIYFVWGWGGTSNGYYLEGSSTPKYGSEGNPLEQSVTNDYSFVNLIYYGDFTPNN